VQRASGLTTQRLNYTFDYYAHPLEVRNHIAKDRGYDPLDHADHYGLFKLPKIRFNPGTAAQWEEELREYGPIIVSGCIGAVEYLRASLKFIRFELQGLVPSTVSDALKQEADAVGHFVLVIGIDNADNIQYLDPLGEAGTGGVAFITGASTRDPSKIKSMGRASFNQEARSFLVACIP
jgi:hypothetical protein